MIGRLGGIRVHPVSVVLAAALAGLALVVAGAGVLVPIGAVLAASGALSSAVYADRAARRRWVDRARLEGAGVRRAVDRAPTVSVIVPALNEERNLPYVLGLLPTGLHEVVLVDGASTDRTVEIAREVRPSIRVIGQHGRGKGDALAAGFEVATGEVLVTLDADGSANPNEIPEFVQRLRDGADFVKGSRFVAEGGSADITALRRLGNWGLTRTVNLLYGTRYTDLCYGFNAFWRDCLGPIGPISPGFEVETELNVRVAKAGLEVAEIPSFEHARLHGSSNLRTFRDGFRVLRTILRESSLNPAQWAPQGARTPARARVRSTTL